MKLKKPFYLSKTLWGAIGTLIFTALIALDIQVTEEEINHVVLLTLDAVSAAFAIYGRLSATHTLTLK